MSISRRIKDIIEPTYKKLFSLCVKIFYYIPYKKNKIAFVQSDGEGYKCNLKYIAEEIHKQQLPYDLVWMINSFAIPIPSFIRKIKYNRISAAYELATAHVVINNLKTSIPVRKKEGQVFIYIPHGQPGAKCAEGDAIISEEYKTMSKAHSALTDIFVSLGSYHTQVLKDTFWVPENAEILECGFPRNDQYYLDTKDKQKAMRKLLNIPDGTRIVYYAPTFRDHGTSEPYNLDLHRVLNALEQKTGEKWIMFTTLHHNFVHFAGPNFKYDDVIWDMTKYPNLHELFLVVDLAITDYSSVSLDFANTGRPVILYASDIENYKKLRGLKPMFFKYPFPLATTNDEMEQAIINFDLDNYKKKLEQFKMIYGSVDDGHASERFVERLKQIMQ